MIVQTKVVVGKMYDKINTACWSIREVNRNLKDRDPMVDYSIEYLKKACSDLSTILTSGGVNLEEEIDVVDRAGQINKFSVREVAEMLTDAKKVIEFNLIDHIDRWARSKSESA